VPSLVTAILCGFSDALTGFGASKTWSSSSSVRFFVSAEDR
jgi:hypothetical protein